MALNKKSLLNRVLVGVAIFVVMFGMIFLNAYLTNPAQADDNIFISGRAISSVIIYALILLSIIEMRRAFGKERIPDSFSWILWLYGFGAGPSYSLFGFTGILIFTLLVFICAVFTSIAKNRIDSLIYIACMLVYPGLLMSTMLYINRSATTHPYLYEQGSAMLPYLENDIWYWLAPFLDTRRVTYLLPLNAIGLAFVFAVSSFTDMFAYFVGGLFGKHKLCPEISPNKTVEGAIGGLFGGALGSALVYFLFDFFQVFGKQCGLTFEGLGLATHNVVIAYVVIGLFGSVATQVGDLLASQVKRFCGIKDYSRILGEHGGIMDRFDGIMLNSALVSFVFMFII